MNKTELTQAVAKNFELPVNKSGEIINHILELKKP